MLHIQNLVVSFIETQVLMKYFLNAHTLSIISNNQNEYSQLINDNETNNIQLRNNKPIIWCAQVWLRLRKYIGN